MCDQNFSTPPKWVFENHPLNKRVHNHNGKKSDPKWVFVEKVYSSQVFVNNAHPNQVVYWTKS